MGNSAKKVYAWASQKAQAPGAPYWLGLLFLLEVGLFVPLDAVLMLFCLENPKRKFLYALIAAIASTLSGIIGYMLGYLLWDIIGPYVVGHLISASFFERLVHQYNHYENLAVFIGSFIPLPFKAVALSAGFCQLGIAAFVGSVLIARLIRFFLIAKAVERWGVQIKQWVDRHFHRVLVAVGAKIAVAFAFFWILGS